MFPEYVKITDKSIFKKNNSSSPIKELAVLGSVQLSERCTNIDTRQFHPETAKSTNNQQRQPPKGSKSHSQHW
jgi:hypothetical protein